MPQEILIELLHDDVVLPMRATAGSAGMDLRAYLREQHVTCSNGEMQYPRSARHEGDVWFLTLEAGEMALIPLGFKTRFDHGLEAQIRPRSGQAFKNALTIPNAPGTIDADYAEEWKVIVRNEASVPKRIVHGDRVAQVVFATFAAAEFQLASVERTTERSGGFGSTGHS